MGDDRRENGSQSEAWQQVDEEGYALLVGDEQTSYRHQHGGTKHHDGHRRHRSSSGPTDTDEQASRCAVFGEVSQATGAAYAGDGIDMDGQGAAQGSEGRGERHRTGEAEG